MKSSHVSVTRPGGWYASGPLVIDLPGPGTGIPALLSWTGRFGSPVRGAGGFAPARHISHEAVDFRCGTVGT